MKIALASDIHLEFGDIILKNDEEADTLILSGDVCVAKELSSKLNSSSLITNFFARCSAEFPNVIYIVGNHEHYNGDFATTIPNLKKYLGHNKNLHILDIDSIELNNIVFIGGTLWTNMNKRDPLTLQDIKRQMNDFRVIKNSGKMKTRKVPLYEKNKDGVYLLDKNGYNIHKGFKFKEEPSTFSPEDSVEEHVNTLDYISSVYDATDHDKTIVVVGHHTPSFMSCDPIYAYHKIMNGAYHSDLSEFILDRPRIKLWTHGHTHHAYDYMIGDTRIVCNPRGYHNYESISKTFKLQYLEI